MTQTVNPNPSCWANTQSTLKSVGSSIYSAFSAVAAKVVELAKIVVAAIGAFFSKVASLASKYTPIAFAFVKAHAKEFGIALAGVAALIAAYCAYQNCNSCEGKLKASKA